MHMQVIHILLNCPFSCKLDNIRLHVIRIHEKMASANYTYLTEHVIFISYTILISMCFGYFLFSKCYPFYQQNRKKCTVLSKTNLYNGRYGH